MRGSGAARSFRAPCCLHRALRAEKKALTARPCDGRGAAAVQNSATAEPNAMSVPAQFAPVSSAGFAAPAAGTADDFNSRWGGGHARPPSQCASSCTRTRTGSTGGTGGTSASAPARVSCQRRRARSRICRCGWISPAPAAAAHRGAPASAATVVTGIDLA